MSWYLQSYQDHDTHQGTLNRGRVSARCDIQFVPLPIAFGRKALPGDPPDPDRGSGARRHSEPNGGSERPFECH